MSTIQTHKDSSAEGPLLMFIQSSLHVCQEEKNTPQKNEHLQSRMNSKVTQWLALQTLIQFRVRLIAATTAGTRTRVHAIATGGTWTRGRSRRWGRRTEPRQMHRKTTTEATSARSRCSRCSCRSTTRLRDTRRCARSSETRRRPPEGETPGRATTPGVAPCGIRGCPQRSGPARTRSSIARLIRRTATIVILVVRRHLVTTHWT